MAKKTSGSLKTYAKKSSVVYVKKAGMWCRTYVDVNEKTGMKTQKQAWFMTREEADA